MTLPYAALADAVLLVHFGVVVFVVAGLLVVPWGNARGWGWVNRVGFRAAHMAAVAVVVLQAWLGAVCPLTTLEMDLRAAARQATYEISFIEHWVQRLLYFDLPTWVFTVAYTLFGLAVAATWWRYPPRWRCHGEATAAAPPGPPRRRAAPGRVEP